LIGWLRGFADRTHHAKEERSLFPALAAAGISSEGGPIEVEAGFARAAGLAHRFSSHGPSTLREDK
jgi:hemerythrin-like domain-containing protein